MFDIAQKKTVMDFILSELFLALRFRKACQSTIDKILVGTFILRAAKNRVLNSGDEDESAKIPRHARTYYSGPSFKSFATSRRSIQTPSASSETCRPPAITKQRLTMRKWLTATAFMPANTAMKPTKNTFRPTLQSKAIRLAALFNRRQKFIEA